MREKDIPHLTLEWKNVIRKKRKYAIIFSKNHTQQNFDLKKFYRNLATKERRKAIKAYWRRKSEELYEKPSDFYKTFKPFLNDIAKDVSEINLRNIDNKTITDRLEITEIFAEYFNNMAANIGGHHVNKLTEEQCNNILV